MKATLVRAPGADPVRVRFDTVRGEYVFERPVLKHGYGLVAWQETARTPGRGITEPRDTDIDELGS